MDFRPLNTMDIPEFYCDMTLAPKQAWNDALQGEATCDIIEDCRWRTSALRFILLFSGFGQLSMASFAWVMSVLVWVWMLVWMWICRRCSWVCNATSIFMNPLPLRWSGCMQTCLLLMDIIRMVRDMVFVFRKTGKYPGGFKVCTFIIDLSMLIFMPLILAFRLSDTMNSVDVVTDSVGELSNIPWGDGEWPQFLLVHCSWDFCATARKILRVSLMNHHKCSTTTLVLGMVQLAIDLVYDTWVKIFVSCYMVRYVSMMSASQYKCLVEHW